MLDLKHILFPIDFSERCCGTAPFVRALAEHYGAKIALLNVLQPFWYSTMTEMPVSVDVDAIKEDLESRLSGVFVTEFANLRVERIVEIGDPASTITKFAHTHGVDLIMMPSHGYGPFRRLLLGSVTAKVLHDAQCPAWTGAHLEERSALDHLSCRSVLCAVDETPKSVALMEWAARYAKDNSATLRLVHVVPGAEAWPDRQFDGVSEEELRQRARETITEFQESAGIAAPLCVAVGEVSRAVGEEARQHCADLLVIGRGSLNETLGRLRTHAYGIIRQAPCPVVSV